MEPPSKRRRLDASPPHLRNGWTSDASNTGPRSQSTSIVDGTGISNSHGDLRVGRDVNIITNHGGHSQPMDTRSALLESLRFDQIGARRQTIKNAHANTCRWFLQTEKYKQWDDKGSSLQNRFLWVKGKPGAGKSTLMKFLHGHISRQTRRTARNTTLISFFFNARGHQLEKSTIGLYRSLLAQLLEMKPTLEYVLDPFRRGHEWTVESLRSVLEEAAQDLEDSPIICLIDALDECDQGQIRDMVSFFETLAHNQTSLQICFASRHYPHINIPTALSIILEEREGHQEDITAYLGSALRIGHSKRAEKIRSELQDKARGVFMWVILVVEILNKDYDAGDVLELEDRIEQLPGDLHALFHDILTRDTKNRQALLLCIQWILYVKDPLTPTQLYLAILSGSDQKFLSNWNSHDHEEADARRYILDKSKGLAEVTKAKIPTVQFIHESVNDFLLKEKGLDRLFSDDLGLNVQGSSQEALKHCCLTYINVGAVSIPRKRWTASSRNSITREFPLLAYANDGILYHAEQAGAHGIDQSDFLAMFQRSAWVRTHNMLEKFTKRRYKPTVSLLYILAEAGLPTLIRAHSKRQSCFQIEAERYGVPILAASSMKHGPTMEVMLELEASRIPTFDFQEFSRQFPLRRDDLDGTSLNFAFKQGQDLLEQLLEHGSDFVTLFHVMMKTHDTELAEEKKNVLLQSAFKYCKTDVVKFLLGYGSLIPKTYPDGQTPLHYASSGGCAELAKLLLDHGSDIMTTNNHGDIPLHLASSADVAKLLILRGSNIEAASGSGRTPLHVASHAGSVALAQVLIDSNACVSAQNKLDGSTPLHTAARSGSLSMVKFLIENGASVSATDNNGDTPLHWLTDWNKSAPAVAKLLVEKGANVSAPNSIGDTTLHNMCRHGSGTMAKALIENGASVSVCNGMGETPLHIAVRSILDRSELAELLIKSGANVSAADLNGDTPLHSLSSHPTTVARVLIANGANVLATNKVGETPLHRVVYRESGVLTIVKLLILHGANATAVDHDGSTVLLDLVAAKGYRHPHLAAIEYLIDIGAGVQAADNNGKTPLLEAASSYDFKLFWLLLERGADLSVADNNGNTPLLVATSYRREKIVSLLLDRGVDVSAANKDGKTPLLEVASRYNSDPFRLLSEHGANAIVADNNRDPFFPRVDNSKIDSEQFRLLLERGADISAADKDGNTPLLVASSHGQTEIVRLLLHRDADISAANKDGETPLLAALSKGHHEIVRILRARISTEPCPPSNNEAIL